MNVRSISEHDLRRFAASDFITDNAESLVEAVTALWESGDSRPAWCFVLEHDDNWIGGILYRSHGGDHDTVFMYTLAVSSDQDFLEIGAHLLEASLKQLFVQGVKQLRRHFTSHDPDAWRQLFYHLAIPLEQEKVAFEWKVSNLLPETQQRLVYRSLDDVGESAFVDAILQVTRGSLDRMDVQTRQSEDPVAAMRQDFKMLQNAFISQGDWWELAYTNGHELVGLSMPVLVKDAQHEGTIAYIGVVPGQRGNGYINELLARCTQILLSTDLEQIIADTDSLNTPMIQAFERLGYAPAGRTWVYVADLAALVG